MLTCEGCGKEISRGPLCIRCKYGPARPEIGEQERERERIEREQEED
jgi:hypothetical protein